MPCSARPEQVVELGRLNGAPSAVPCTSTNSPDDGHHHVHVDLGPDVLGVVEVEQRHAVDDADADRRARLGERVGLERALLHQPGAGVVQGDVGAADRRGAGAAVGLEDVAVEDDLHLAQRLHVGDRRAATGR